MKSLIKEELKTYNFTYDSGKAERARKALYYYLCEDEILFELARQFTYEHFSDSIDYLKAMGLKYSKSRDYIPVAAFCFMLPLAFSANFFIEKEASFGEYIMMLTSYFGEMEY
ncbi:MAG: hypothetical protein IJF73_05425 [Clostridia bacterium]|nr:hypothetical protein [Clostridia bacterium]